MQLDEVREWLRQTGEEAGVAWTMLVQSQRTIERVDPDAVRGCWRLFLGPGSVFEIGRPVEVLEHRTVVLHADAESILIPALNDGKREPGELVGHPAVMLPALELRKRKVSSDASNRDRDYPDVQA